MNRYLVSLLALTSIAGQSPALRAQSAQPTQPAQSTQPTAPTAAQQTPTPSANTEKKVWTNDDVTDLRDRAPISTVGNNDPKSTKAPLKVTGAPASKTREKWYVDQIHALQAKIPPLDEKIQQLQAALKGDQVNAPRPYGWSRPDDWRDQLQRLQKQREDIQTKINALEDQARHDGVPPNVLPQ